MFGGDDLPDLRSRLEHLLLLKVENSDLPLIPVHTRHRPHAAQARSLDWLKQRRGWYPVHLNKIEAVALHDGVLLHEHWQHIPLPGSDRSRPSLLLSDGLSASLSTSVDLFCGLRPQTFLLLRGCGFDPAYQLNLIFSQSQVSSVRTEF